MEDRNFVIVGAGQAGRRAAEELRAREPLARIILIGDESHLPYDRPPLSKDVLASEDAEIRVFVRDAEHYKQLGIELHLGVAVKEIDRHAKTVVMSDGRCIPYFRLLLATGSRVRKLDAQGVNYLRTLEDARTLRLKLTAGAHVVILGGGFVGLEVAAASIRRGCRVTVIDPADRLLKRTMPTVVSQFAHDLHTRYAVTIRLDTRVTHVDTLDDGTFSIGTSAGVIQADAVVAGIGVVPNTELAQAAGLEVDEGIVVDEYCRTTDPEIFSAGEVTRHFIHSLGRRMRVESWQVAEKQPAVAAANMLGESALYNETPWLWSDQYDCNFQCLGAFDEGASILMRGEVASGQFSVLALDDQRCLRGAVTINSGRDMAALRRLSVAGPLDPALLANDSIPLKSLLTK
jgi:anthranilate 1,2-dioxygenase ferredoxin reductase subunit